MSLSVPARVPGNAMNSTMTKGDMANNGVSASLGERRGHRITLHDISHSYGGARALDGIDFEIEPGELVALLGPSGCGKTTLLRIIAGFVAQSRGEVRLDGHRIDALDAGRRGIGIVFQNYALFPHLNVLENVSYGPLAQGAGRRRAREVATEMLARVKMSDFGTRLPRELSGGQQQRVALARALAISPRIMLLDEPFSALDKALRLDMQSEVKTLLKGTGVTSIMVTHDQEEALSMADRIVVLSRGKIEQIGSPVEVYNRPASLFVAGFIGSMNLLPGRVVQDAGGTAGIALASGRILPCPPAQFHAEGARVTLGIRPENLTITDRGPLKVRVTQLLPLGPVDIVEVVLEDSLTLRVSRSQLAAESPSVGDEVSLGIIDASRCSLFAH